LIKELKYGAMIILFAIFSLFLLQISLSWEPAPLLGFIIFLVVFSVTGGFIIHSYDKEIASNS